MKISVLSSSSFLVNGNAYIRGDYAPEYRNGDVRLMHVTTREYINPQWINWSAFTDSNDAAYADYAAFVTALTLILAPGTADATISSSTGTVTQATSKTTGVTLNNKSGVITTVALTDAADAGFKFTLTNSYITATSVILLTPIYAGTQGKIELMYETPGAGSVVIVVTNSGTQALNALAKVAFAIVA